MGHCSCLEDSQLSRVDTKRSRFEIRSEITLKNLKCAVRWATASHVIDIQRSQNKNKRTGRRRRRRRRRRAALLR